MEQFVLSYLGRDAQGIADKVKTLEPAQGTEWSSVPFPKLAAWRREGAKGRALVLAIAEHEQDSWEKLLELLEDVRGDLLVIALLIGKASQSDAVANYAELFSRQEARGRDWSGRRKFIPCVDGSEAVDILKVNIPELREEADGRALLWHRRGGDTLGIIYWISQELKEAFNIESFTAEARLGYASVYLRAYLATLGEDGERGVLDTERLRKYVGGAAELSDAELAERAIQKAKRRLDEILPPDLPREDSSYSPNIGRVRGSAANQRIQWVLWRKFRMEQGVLASAVAPIFKRGVLVQTASIETRHASQEGFQRMLLGLNVSNWTDPEVDELRKRIEEVKIGQTNKDKRKASGCEPTFDFDPFEWDRNEGRT